MGRELTTPSKFRKAGEMLRFRLFIAGNEPNSRKALDIVRRIQERLMQAEATLEALRRGEVDMLVGESEPLVVRFKSLVEKERRFHRAEKIAGEWQTTFDAMADSIWILDTDFRVIHSNRASEEVFHCNNLLGIILGYGTKMVEGLRDGDPLRADAQAIVTAGKRSAALTRQLLAFSRKQILQAQFVDLNLLVRDMEKMLCRLIGEDIALETEYTDTAATILADPGQIEQVIMNLAVNARDAMPHGGRLSIKTFLTELDDSYTSTHTSALPGDYVLLSVTDTGCGMDRATIEQIFDPFFTTKELGRGTGLGLSTVYGIVKQSGGNIWAYSEPGQGSCFKIYLPHKEQQPAVRKTGPVEANATGRGEHVLLVEDDEALRELFLEILSRAGFNVSGAANGGEALLQIEEKGLRPDIVITDVIMPGMSGSVLIDRLKRTIPNLKYLYMSGYTDEKISLLGVLDSGTPFIQKPFTMKEIVATIRKVMDR